MASQLKAKAFETTVRSSEPGTLRRLTPQRVPELIDEALHATPEATPAEVFTRLGKTLARAEGRACWVEKTPHHVLYHARILASLPRARLVVMIREPYAFAKSYKHQPGHARTPQSRKRFDERYHPIGAGLVWLWSFQAAMRLLTAHPDQALLVHCEELAARPGEVLARVLAFFGIPDPHAAHPIAGRVNSAFAGEPEPELEDTDVFWFNRVVRGEIERVVLAVGAEAALLVSRDREPGWSTAKLVPGDLRSTLKTGISSRLRGIGHALERTLGAASARRLADSYKRVVTLLAATMAVGPGGRFPRPSVARRSPPSPCHPPSRRIGRCSSSSSDTGCSARRTAATS